MLVISAGLVQVLICPLQNNIAHPNVHITEILLKCYKILYICTIINTILQCFDDISWPSDVRNKKSILKITKYLKKVF